MSIWAYWFAYEGQSHSDNTFPLQFLDRQRLMSSCSPHASVLSWLYNRYKGVHPAMESPMHLTSVYMSIL